MDEKIIERAMEVGDEFLAWTPETGPCPISLVDISTIWGKRLCGLFERIAILEDKNTRLREQVRWIPMSQPPTHHRPVILAKLDNDWMQTGIWAVSGWYDTIAKKWIYPTGHNRNYDHYMDCLIDNRKSQPPKEEE